MGPRYQQGALLAVMAAGALLPLTQQPVQRILTGLDLHGRLALVSLGAAVVGVTASLLAVGTFGGGLIAAALALAVPHSLGNGLLVGLYACRRLDVPVREYVWRAWMAPLLYVLPFALSLVAVRVLFTGRPGVAVLAGLLAGVLTLPPVYWFFLLSDAARQGLRRRLGLAAAPSAA
jgi:O-antigen/teichoic acid export membrane protein